MATRKTRGLIGRLMRIARRAPPADALATAEAQARQAQTRLREALDALPEGIVILDPEGRYVLWNKKYAEIYHRSADLFREGAKLADTLREGVARGDYPDAVGRENEWLEARLASLANPGPRHEQRLSDGRWIMIEERKTADGGVIGVRVDITEMKAQAARLEEALAEARQASRAKSDFLANMSHEIRTPLNGVIGLADVLARTNLDDHQRSLLKTIVASANDLDVLLGDILDFSRLEAGKIEIQSTPIVVESLVEECVALFHANAARKGLTLSVKAAPDACGAVLGDPTRIKQVLTNLLSNAVKFTARGGVELIVERTADGERRFEVRDTGVGFDPADAARLFERFEQADGSTTRQFGGTGLGLAICKQLTELMGGQISAWGRKGEGAVFTVILPLQPCEAAKAATPAAASPDPDALKVLAVDDNPTNLKVLELMLQSMGAQVDTAANGALAVEAARRRSYDLVLMDMQMPVMDGIAATRAIREMAAAPPVIMVSANNTPSDRAASAQVGVCAHIGKPLRVEELISTILSALGDETLARVA